VALDFQYPIARRVCRLSGLGTMSPIRIIIRGPTRLVLIWDGEVTADLTTRATTGIGDTTATTIPAKAIISASGVTIIPAKAIISGTSGATNFTAKAIILGTSGAAIRDVIGADEMNVRPGDGPSWHNGSKLNRPDGKIRVCGHLRRPCLRFAAVGGMFFN